MTKRKLITRNKMPERTCPRCGYPVLKAVIYAQLSYECTKVIGSHWGPWDEAVKDPLASKHKALSREWKNERSM